MVGAVCSEVLSSRHVRLRKDDGEDVGWFGASRGQDGPVSRCNDWPSVLSGPGKRVGTLLEALWSTSRPRAVGVLRL